jgi:hypothetical protein
MKLKQIGEIATRPVPVWQPALLGLLLLLGFTVVPLIAKKTAPPPSRAPGSTLGVSTIKDTLQQGATSLVQPYVQSLQHQAENALGVAQQAATDVVITSTQQAKDYVIDNTVGKVLGTVQSLPADQLDLIKKAICK